VSKIWLAEDDEGTIDMDAYASQMYLEGQRGGLQRIAGLLQEEAVVLFKMGKDEEAIRLRDRVSALEVKILSEIEIQIDKNQKDHPWRISENKKR